MQEYWTCVGSGTILVMDDEDFVLRMARSTLARLGFEVEIFAGTWC